MIKKNKLFILLLIIVLAFSLVSCGKKNEKTDDNKTKVKLVDNAKREVEINVPVKRAVVISRYNNELVRATGAIDKVVGVDLNTSQDREYWKNFNPDENVGKGQRDLNYEKIIELKPEIVIIPKNGSYKEAEEKLKAFNIKVFVVSGYDTDDFENQVDNIGKIFGSEKKAKEFKDYYLGIVKKIQERLKGVKKKTIYWEATKDYKTSFPGNYYFNMIVKSGALNIFHDGKPGVSDTEITPEDIVTRNPEFIVKNITPKKALKGTGVYEAPPLEQRKQIIEDIKKRPGFDSIKAVKNNNIYLMSQFGHGGAGKIVGSVFIAKWVYPEELKDINPEDVLKRWLEVDQGFKYVDGHFYPLKKNE